MSPAPARLAPEPGIKNARVYRIEGKMEVFFGGGMATRLCVAMFLASSRLMATQRRVAMPPSHAPSTPRG